jgi:hypothetical protein
LLRYSSAMLSHQSSSPTVVGKCLQSRLYNMDNHESMLVD